MGVNQHHWGWYGAITIELRQTFYSAGAYQRWEVKAGFGDFSGSATLVERFGETDQYARVSLGQPVLTGNSYGGYPNQYIPIYLDFSNYTHWQVKIDYTWPVTTNPVPEYSQLTLFDSPVQTVIQNQLAYTPDLAARVDGTQGVFPSNGPTPFSYIQQGSGAYGFFEIGIPNSVDNKSFLSLHRGGSIAYQLGISGSDLVFAQTGGTGKDYLDSERFRIAANGNIGVGTTTPGAKLDVAGGIHASGGVVSYSSGPTGLFSGNGSGLDGSTFQQFALFADTSNGLLFEAPKDPAGNRLDVTFNWRGGGVNPPLRIKGDSGRVGIGTPSPTALLDVAGDTHVAGNLTVDGTFTASSYGTSSGVVSGGVTGLTLNAGGTNQNVTISPSGTGATILNGNVGVGTTPAYKFQIAGNNAVQPQLPDFSLDTNAWFNFGHDSGYGYIGWFTQGTGSGFVNTHSSVSPTLIRASNGALTIYSSTSAGFGNPSNFFPELSVTATGVAIGTTTADTALTVKGTIHASEVVVDAKVTAKVIRTNDVLVQPKAWADDVFDDGRPLQPLSAVEQSIKEHKHLPGVPSAQEVSANGVSVADMQTVLLQKIEELTLHQIEQQKLLEAQSRKLSEQGSRIEQLERENATLRTNLR